MARDSTFVYVATFGTPQDPIGSISKVPINGGSAVTLVSSLGQLNGIAVDANFVYWIENTPGTCTVRRVHK